MNIEKVSIKDIKMNPNNPRIIKDDKFKKLVKSIKEFPEMLEVRPIVVDDDMVILGGNMRTKACIEAGLKEVFIIKFSDLTDDKKKEFIVKDNVGYGEWDFDVLKSEWDVNTLIEWGLDLPKDTGLNQYGDEKKSGTLNERFIVPPFSVLDTKQGYWSDRKKIWKERINDNGESREGTLSKGGDNLITTINDGVSLLDPVLSEIIVSWFGIENGKCFDCFSGDTVFGYVSSYMGNIFTGIELREEQVKLNNKRCKDDNLTANYICDDGRNVHKHIEANSQDLLFSCPPYYDLEVYSDLDNDASNQETYEDFLLILDDAFKNAITCLKDDRFAVIVVGDIRDKQGYYYGFTDDIKNIFRKYGMPLYNELILLDNIGSAPMRANSFMKKRKVVKVHQNVLVFYKGNVENIKNNYKSLSYESTDV
jgi:hypothetical protein